MTESFANEAQTTLNGAINDSTTSITVTSATGFPSSGNYRIRIDDEFMLVTAGQGTTSWTVTREAEDSTRFPAASHSNGATVTHVLTAGGLQALVYPETWEDVMTALSGNLVHRWKFEEASGNFADSVASLDLTAAGSPTYQVASPLGYAATMSTAQAASGGVGSLPTGSSDRTLIAVFKVGVTNSHTEVFSYGATSTRQWQQGCLNHDDYAQGPCYLAWSDDHKPAGFFADNHWHMVAWRSRSRAGEVWADGATHSARAWGAALSTGTSYPFRVASNGTVTIADFSAWDHWMPNVDLRRLWNTIKDGLDI
jgi:hypothetical protein